MDKRGKWEDYLHLLEFAYNNNFQVSPGMGPFEILYERKCNTPISWIIPVDRSMLVPELLKDMELTVKQVRKKLKVAQDRNFFYPSLKRNPIELYVGVQVYIKVNPKKIYLRLGKY